MSEQKKSLYCYFLYGQVLSVMTTEVQLNDNMTTLSVGTEQASQMATDDGLSSNTMDDDELTTTNLAYGMMGNTTEGSSSGHVTSENYGVNTTNDDVVDSRYTTEQSQVRRDQ